MNNYTRKTDELLKSIHFNHHLLLCDNVHCDNIAHQQGIDMLYGSIMDCLLDASADVLKECKVSDNQVLGWNDICKEVHAKARDAFLNWNACNRPKQGLVFNVMKKTRATFKYVLRHCKKQDSKAKADILAMRFLNKDSRSFWKELKKINGNDKNVLASTVNGVSGHNDIANMWHDYYKTLLNSTKRPVTRNFVSDHFQHCNSDDFKISPDEVKESIKDLKKGKSAGLDHLSSEHFKFASDRLYVLLSIVFNSMLLHGHLPSIFMDTLIIPIVKNKKGDVTDGDNYRPIAITSIASKILELIMLERFSLYLVTTDNQFGFKNGVSTELCIFSLKQTIGYYKSMSSPVYVCFMDASKAFDRINHCQLFNKLIIRGVPLIAVRLLCNWYSTQIFHIQWGSVLSQGFSVTNGVRQGGIMSPILFNVYIDDLSKELSNMKIGCHFNDVNVNHLVYADDTVLLAPSPSALQKLINCCVNFAESNDIFYNFKKTKCMCIRPKGLKDLYFPKLYLEDKVITCVEKEKYLGCFITDDLSDDDDLQRQMCSIYARGNVLIRNFKNCTPDIKILLFKTYCTGFYGSATWSNCKRKSFNKLRVAFNNIFRTLMGISRLESMSRHMLDSKVDNFRIVMRKYMVNLIKRIEDSKNSIVKALYDWLEFKNCTLFNLWCKEAYT